jgi:hypothetical protein
MGDPEWETESGRGLEGGADVGDDGDVPPDPLLDPATGQPEGEDGG